MKKSIEADLKRSEAIEALSRAQRADEPDQAEIGRLSEARETAEQEYRAAVREEAEAETTATEPEDAEAREVERLRREATATRYLLAGMRGKMPDGPEAEYAAAVGVADGIPLALFDDPPSARGRVEERADAVTPAPTAGTGVNLHPIQPHVFAESLAPRLGIDMPMVRGGTFSTATITTALTAAAKAAGADAQSTKAVLTAQTSGVKRVSGRLSIREEDIAAVGQANFESALRQNLAAVMSDKLDDLAINGDGTAPNPKGLLAALTAATAESTTGTFALLAAKQAGVVDGLWARTLRDIFILCGVDTYKHAAGLFRGSDDSTSALEYLTRVGGGVETHKRMPAAASGVQTGLAFRRGRMGMQTAVCPVWNRITIDDVYSDSAAATRHVTMHVLCGDVLIVQSGAYEALSFKVA